MSCPAIGGMGEDECSGFEKFDRPDIPVRRLHFLFNDL
jgi:hypothetical protein